LRGESRNWKNLKSEFWVFLPKPRGDNEGQILRNPFPASHHFPGRDDRHSLASWGVELSLRGAISLLARSGLNLRADGGLILGRRLSAEGSRGECCRGAGKQTGRV
jgi:hypothetical protein